MRLWITLFTIMLFSASQAAERPNLLFIFMDDYGWKDTSYMGSDFYETPNIDALAEDGMILPSQWPIHATPRSL